MDDSGALSKSAMALLRACISGGSIVVLRLERLESTNIDNFSQIFSVPKEKSGDFERALIAEAGRLGYKRRSALNRSFSA